MFDVETALNAVIPMLRRHANLLLHDPGVAEDMVYRCLLVGMDRLNGTDDPKSIGLILLQLLHGHCRELACASPSSDRSVSEREAPYSGAATGDRAIEVGFRTLSYDDRAILLLVSVERLSYEEAARILAIPIFAVASRVAGARRALSGLLESGNPPEGLRD